MSHFNAQVRQNATMVSSSFIGEIGLGPAYCTRAMGSKPRFKEGSSLLSSKRAAHNQLRGPRLKYTYVEIDTPTSSESQQDSPAPWITRLNREEESTPDEKVEEGCQKSLGLWLQQKKNSRRVSNLQFKSWKDTTAGFSRGRGGGPDHAPSPSLP